MKAETIKNIILNLEHILSVKTPTDNEELLSTVEVLLDFIYSIESIMFIFDSSANILWVNNSFNKMLGYDTDEFKTSGFALLNSYCHPEDLYIIKERKQLISQGKNFKDLVRIRHKNGEYVWMNVDATVFKSHLDGKPYLFIGELTNITKFVADDDGLQASMPDSKRLLNIHILDCKLTVREKEILKLISDGNSTKAIADKLIISFHTVRTHRTNLMKKLNINCIAGLINFYRDHSDSMAQLLHHENITNEQ